MKLIEQFSKHYYYNTQTLSYSVIIKYMLFDSMYFVSFQACNTETSELIYGTYKGYNDIFFKQLDLKNNLFENDVFKLKDKISNNMLLHFNTFFKDFMKSFIYRCGL